MHFMIIAAPVCGRVSYNVTADTNATTCGNCKRTNAFKDAAKSGVEVLATPEESADLMDRIRGLSHKVTSFEAPANGRTLYYADCSCGYGSDLYAEENDAIDVAKGHGKVSRIPASQQFIAEDSEGAVSVWKFNGSKVKNTRAARRYRKGA